MSLGYLEMTPIPMSCFSKKDQLMYEGNKATFAKKCLKDNVLPIKFGSKNQYPQC